MDGKNELGLISDAEWLLMECLWDNGPMYMAELVAMLEPKTAWSRTTVLTLASRLEKKAYLGTERSKKAYLYVPVVNRKTSLQMRVDSFLHACFNGEVYPLVRFLLDMKALNEDEERKLRSRLKKLIEARENDKEDEPREKESPKRKEGGKKRAKK